MTCIAGSLQSNSNTDERTDKSFPSFQDVLLTQKLLVKKKISITSLRKPRNLLSLGLTNFQLYKSTCSLEVTSLGGNMPCSDWNVCQEQPRAGLSIHGSLHLTQAFPFRKHLSCPCEFREYKRLLVKFLLFFKEFGINTNIFHSSLPICVLSSFK